MTKTVKCHIKNAKKISALLFALITAVFSISSFPVNADEDISDNITGGKAVVNELVSDIGYSAVLYDADNGLPTSDANTILSSSDGFIWIGGYSGLIRYDGTSFERQDHSGGITSVNILYEDSKGRIWVGTNDNGVVCLYNGNSRHLSYEDGLIEASISSIAEDDKGNILIGTRDGVYYIQEDRTVGTVSDSQIVDAYIIQLKRDIDGNVIGVTDSGAVFRISGLRVTEYYNDTDIGIDGVSAVLPSTHNKDEIWLGTELGEVCEASFADNFGNIKKSAMYYKETVKNGTDETAEKTVPVLATEPVQDLYYCEGRVFVLMQSRIFFADGYGGYRQLEDIPLDGGIQRMTEDWEGNLWFASRRQGVMKIAANKFFDVTTHAGLAHKIVNTTCIHNGRIYIGTDTGLQITNTAYIPVKNELSEYMGDTRIRCITKDNDDNLWLSTYTNDMGLVCYTADKEIISFTEADGLPSNKVRCTAVTSDGAVLAGTNGGIAVIRDYKIERIIDEDKGLNNPVILTVEEVDGKYYLGSDGDGIYVAEGNKITHLYREDGLTSGVILRIKKDEKRNVIWIVTSNSIQYIQDGIIKKVEAFPYTNNYDIYFDSENNAWVPASSGIYVVNAEEMITRENFDYAFYNISDGLPCVPTSNSFSCIDENGELFLAGRSGVTRVNIDQFFVESHDIRFSVPYIEDDKRRYYPDKNNTFELPSNAKSITIYNYALTYMMHDPQIEYFLDGADSQPITVNKSDMAPLRYTNLRGGEYDFSLSLIDNASHTVRQTVSYHIVKNRAYYEQWWFYVICVCVNILVIIFIIRYVTERKTTDFLKREREQQKLQRLFEQTATALVNAIDAKDKYTHGHSARVAEYSRKIAELCGMDERQCLEVYYAGLLHDVGKIGVPASVINKDGRLTDEEYEMIRQHPVTGYQILKSIREYPFLSIGARYHHERYDGRGYPDGVKGTDIPDIARIVSVADAYDAMTSKRSYRDPIPQQKVREEFVKGSGTQFDPEYAKMMLHLIDLDTEYELKEREEISELEGNDDLVIGEHRSIVSEGILITPAVTKICLKIRKYDNSSNNRPSPSLILFDSLDGCFHSSEKEIKDLLYFEYGEILFSGDTVPAKCRQI